MIWISLLYVEYLQTLKQLSIYYFVEIIHKTDIWFCVHINYRNWLNHKRFPETSYCYNFISICILKNPQQYIAFIMLVVLSGNMNIKTSKNVYESNSTNCWEISHDKFCLSEVHILKQHKQKKSFLALL